MESQDKSEPGLKDSGVGMSHHSESQKSEMQNVSPGLISEVTFSALSSRLWSISSSRGFALSSETMPKPTISYYQKALAFF